MTGKELFIGLSYIDRKYIDEAENGVLPGSNLTVVPSAPKTRKRPRILLIAAIAALMLLLVGCAVVYVLRLQELQMGEYRYTQPRYIDEDGNKVYETEISRDVLSLQGIAGSPNFQAAQEWFVFEQAYDPDYVLLNEADKNPIEVSSEYDAYFVYTREMVDKIDEITEKYGLELAGENVGVEDYQMEIFFDALGIERLHKTDGELQYASGYFYSSGNFDMDFYITMTTENDSLEHELFGSYRYNGKAYFDTVFSSVSSIEDCEEWVHTLSDGQEVLIVTDDTYIRVFCDRENAFISLHLDRTYRNEDGTESQLTNVDIVKIVDSFDFSIVPQKPDMEETKRKLEESFEAYKKEQEARMETYVNPFKRDYETYDDVIRFILDGDHVDAYLYALRDITGDGREELFIGRDGSFGTIKTMADGKPTTLWSNGTDHGLELCEGDILRYTNGDRYCFMKLDKSSGQFVQFLSLGYDPWEESWYYTEEGCTDMNYISKDVFEAMLASYEVIDIGMKPISEFPIN